MGNIKVAQIITKEEIIKMEELKKSYKEIQKFIGQKVYRICPKCNDEHNGER